MKNPLAILLWFVIAFTVLGADADFSATIPPANVQTANKMDPKLIQVYTAAMLMMLGRVIKGIDWIPDRYIPMVLWFAGVAIYCFQTDWSRNSIMDGLLCAGAAIGLNQTAKQMKPEEPVTMKEVVEAKKIVAEAETPKTT